MFLQLKCGNCGEVTEKETYVVLGEVVPIPKSRGNANLVQKVYLYISNKLLLLFYYDLVVLYLLGLIVTLILVSGI